MKKSEIRTNWGTVAYWTSERWEAERGTIFFLHGLTADHTMFQHQYPYFEEGYSLIVCDAPAHGQSRLFGAFTYEKAALAAKTILEACRVPTAIFVGQSMGGYIAQSVIKRWPRLVKAFVSIDSTPFGADYHSKSDRWWLRQVKWMARLCPLNWMKREIGRFLTSIQIIFSLLCHRVRSEKPPVGRLFLAEKRRRSPAVTFL